MRPLLAAAAASVLVMGPLVGTATADDGESVAFTMTDPRITESSGLVASRLHKGVYWTHNDSDDGPYIYAVDSATGKTVATVTLRGVGSPRDVEAISMGPDGALYVGDIGDNLGGSWPHVWIYRLPEPKRLADQTVTATQFTVRYDGGPRNAEAMMVDPKTGRVYIASKNEDGGGLYEGPAKLSASGTNVFRRVADIPLWITDGAFSPDGTRLVLRGYFGALMYRWADGTPHRIDQMHVPLQRQGESVAFTPDGRTLMYGSEGEDSEVWRVPLTGEDLPDAARRAGTSAPGSPGSAGGTSADAGSGTEGPGSTRQFALGALTLAAVAAVLVGVRRLLRRGGRSA
jgi:sugar lactone lactonase YvrE